ncbi:MAG: DUF763 domain-containing protein [Candidatus Bathyarchaeia archaeon]
MKRTGVAKLPLHYGRAPQWLVTRMTKLADAVVTIIVDEYGHDEFLRRISDPFWFQALGCVLGYDWHSSGVTTVLTGVLKAAVNPKKHGVAVCGGKGKASLKAPTEIHAACETFGFSTGDIDRLVYSSKMSAKVDNTAIQAGYPLYHHAFFLSENGKWTVIQQGMSTQDRTARRYHWLSEHVKEFVVEPHEAIVGNAKRDAALNMTAKESEECRKTSVDVAKEKPDKIKRLLESAKPTHQKSLQQWMPNAKGINEPINVLSMPRKINWNALREAYEFQPKNYQELLAVRGVGPATVRGLALVAEIIYGKPPSWKDPVKFSFAYGGKDGVPKPVDKRAMDKSIQILQEAIQNAQIDNKTKLKAFKKLRQYVD